MLILLITPKHTPWLMLVTVELFSVMMENPFPCRLNKCLK